MSSTSISSSDSAILNAQQKTGPRGMGVGIDRGDFGLDLGRDRKDRARIEPENNIATLVNYTCKSFIKLTPGKRKPLLLSQKKGKKGEL